MNSIKRQLSFTEAGDDVIKKNRKMACFGDLPNELFVEIFDYLDGFDIYNAFSKLNIRFESLLTYLLFPIKIKLPFGLRVSLEDYCRQLIIPNKHRIISLQLEGDQFTKDFHKYCIIDSSFSCLELVTLQEISINTILMVLSYLKSLSRLLSLRIHFKKSESYDKLGDVYKYILCLPYLKYNEVSLSTSKLSEFFVPMHINEKPSGIERLNINFPCTINELTSILLHTPYLKHLFCRGLWNSMERNKNINELKLSHLTHISIGENSISLRFNNFKTFIPSISYQLRTLSLQTRTPEYFDADQWKTLIRNHMPCLSKFNLEYSTLREEFSIPKLEVINQFILPFWIERAWLFKLEYRFSELTYFIYPYRKKWFDDYIDDEIIPQINTSISKHVTNFSNSFISPIHLSIKEDAYTFSENSFFIKLVRRYYTIRVTHLSIDSEKFFIDDLIDILELLPAFDTLEISSSLYTLSHHSPLEKSKSFISASSANKITKVKMNGIYEMEYISGLMSLCPRMKYFELNCSTKNELENIVLYIITKSNTHVLKLKCLCLCIAEADENMVENLRMMIDDETRSSINQSFNNYTLRRIQNKIFLNI